MESKPDLELKALGQFIGTTQYYGVLGFNVTDGVKYVMDNGYSWFVTDALAVIKCYPKLRTATFLTVELKLTGDNEADMLITDGNENTLYTQHYQWTNAKKEFTLFYEHGVLILNSEH